MTMITAADTRVRPASAVLEARLSEDPSDVTLDTAALDALALEQARLGVEISTLIGRMTDPATTAAALDRLADRIAALLVTAEDLRHTRARAAAVRAGDESRWRDYLELA